MNARMRTSLSPYAAKRAFDRTPEPAARLGGARSGPLLFVVQQHAARRLHYDFRLEVDGVLKSWAIPKGPSLDPAVKRLAAPTEDHPFDYASFEGVIPRGQYGAGEVIVWDCGVFVPEREDGALLHDRAEADRYALQALERGKLSFLLRGVKLKGSFALVRTARDNQWLLIKHKDSFVGESDVDERGRSVLSSLRVEDLTSAEPPPRIVSSRLVPNGPRRRMPT
ncbi:MAG: DNA polymerase ligase N-terminal domain-containing protein, partial [Steroidobacteraceae bacterium]